MGIPKALWDSRADDSPAAYATIDHSDIRGRNRMVMIRRELPRTKRAGWVRKPYRIESLEDSPFRGPCTAIGSAVHLHIRVSVMPPW
jgi:hypothetical protein